MESHPLDGAPYIVTTVSGTAFLIQSNGSRSSIETGEQIAVGEAISLGPNSQLTLTSPQVNSNSEPQVIELKTPGTYQYESLALVESTTNQDKAVQNQTVDEVGFDPNQLEATAAGSDESSLELIGENADSIASLQQLINSEEPTLFSRIENDTSNNSEASLSPGFTGSEQQVSGSPDENALLSFRDGETLDFSPDNYELFPTHVSEDRNTVRTGDSGNGEQFEASAIATNYGQFYIETNGTWRYELNNSLDEIQSLGAGDSLTDEVSYQSINGSNYTLQININGSNDAAIIQGDNRGSLTEDQSLAAEGSLSISDSDQGEAEFKAISEFETAYGSVSVDTEGHWNYELNNNASAVQSLREGDNISDTFAVISADGSSEIIKISITGSNDIPVISGSNNTSLDLGNALTSDGQLTVNDADFGESQFVSQNNINASYGQGSIDASGHWQYQVDVNHPDIQALGSGNFLYDQFQVATADGTSAGIIVKIEGSDTPLTEQPAIASVTQDLYLWSPEQEHNESIEGFAIGPHGDTLVLSELLSEQADADSLDHYLHFSVDEQGTTLHIDVDGNFGESDQSSTGSHAIVLQDLDLSSFGNSDGEIIQNLIDSGNLEVLGLA